MNKITASASLKSDNIYNESSDQMEAHFMVEFRKLPPEDQDSLISLACLLIDQQSQ